MPYLYDAHEGGRAIPDAIRNRTEQRLRAYATEHLGYRDRDLIVRFRAQFCYLDLLRTPDPVTGTKEPARVPGDVNEAPADSVLFLGRMRYFGNPDRWSFAIYSYTTESYEPCTFPSREAAGTPEEAFEMVVGIIPLQERRHPAARRPRAAGR